LDREIIMEELIGRLTAATGIDAELAQKSVGLILSFLQKEGPPDAVGQLMGALPGADALVSQAGEGGGGGGGLLGGLASMMGGGGGIMGLGSQLMGAGLGMGQIQTVSKELFAYGREKAGEDVMGEIVGAIPGLSQFV
jgi:hypothetical protein